MSIEKNSAKHSNEISFATSINFLKRRYISIFQQLIPALALTYISFVSINAIDFSDHQINSQLIASLTGIQNIYLWLNTSYFEPAAQLNPFLPLWSISLEIQAYVLICFAPILFNHLGYKYFINLVIACIISSILIKILMSSSDAAVFYLIPTRIWEFLIGVLAYYARAIPSQYRISLSCKITGIFILVFVSSPLEQSISVALTFFLLQQDYKIKNPSKIMIFFGQNSLPLFLYHFWPIALFKTYFFSQPSFFVQIIILAISCSIGVAIQSALKKYLIHGKQSLVTVATHCCSITLILSSVFLSAQIRLPKGPEVTNANSSICSPLYNPDFSFDTCFSGTDEYQKKIDVIIGDSWAKNFVTQEYNRVYWYPGCPPATTLRKSFEIKPSCSANNTKLLNFINDNRHKIRAIFLYYRLPLYLQGPARHSVFKEFHAPVEFFIGDTDIKATEESISSSIEDYLGRLSKLAPLVVMYGIPEFGADPVTYHKIHSTYPKISLQDHRQRTMRTESLLEKISKGNDITFVDVTELFCTSKFCSQSRNDVLMYDDNNHLNATGVDFVHTSITKKLLSHDEFRK